MIVREEICPGNVRQRVQVAAGTQGDIDFGRHRRAENIESGAIKR
jgi:hypothetical protein